jgi:hypothetical protein
MKMKLIVVMTAGMLAAGMSIGWSTVVSAQTINYDAGVTPINGSGNASTGWSQYTDTTLNYSIGLMAEYNYPSYPGNANSPANPNNGAGTYTFPAGLDPDSTYNSQWNYWFSINVDPNNTPGVTLANSGLSFFISVEAPGGSFGPEENILTYYSDNAYGNNSTAAGAGVDGTAGTSAGLQGEYNIAQNSENIAFGPTDASLSQVNEAGVWTIQVTADQGGTQVGQFDEEVQVVPEPSTYAMAGMGCLGLFGFKRFRRQATA